MRQSHRLDTQDIAKILLEPHTNEEKLCSIQPLNIEHNTVFVVDLSKLKNTKDIFCDDMGSWKHSGVFTTWLEVDENGFTTTYGKVKPIGHDNNVYHLTKKYFVHKVSQDLKKTVAFVAGTVCMFLRTYVHAFRGWWLKTHWTCMYRVWVRPTARCWLIFCMILKLSFLGTREYET